MCYVCEILYFRVMNSIQWDFNELRYISGTLSK